MLLTCSLCRVIFPVGRWAAFESPSLLPCHLAQRIRGWTLTIHTISQPMPTFPMALFKRHAGWGLRGQRSFIGFGLSLYGPLGPSLSSHTWANIISGLPLSVTRSKTIPYKTRCRLHPRFLSTMSLFQHLFLLGFALVFFSRFRSYQSWYSLSQLWNTPNKPPLPISSPFLWQ